MDHIFLRTAPLLAIKPRSRPRANDTTPGIVLVIHHGINHNLVIAQALMDALKCLTVMEFTCWINVLLNRSEMPLLALDLQLVLHVLVLRLTVMHHRYLHLNLLVLVLM